VKNPEEEALDPSPDKKHRDQDDEYRKKWFVNLPAGREAC
jgi:hypothetical protein